MGAAILGSIDFKLFSNYLLANQHCGVSSDICLIDMRSESEYAKGHIPGAVNVPLLDDQEREIIGTLYKKEGKHEAVSLGLHLFSQKCHRFLQTMEQLTIPEGMQAKKSVLYCARGGLRSRLTYAWLKALGFEVEVLKGGYKTFRQEILKLIDQLSFHKIWVLNGYTGSGKTEFLKDLAKQNLPTMDLEEMACHRGSAFGGIAQEFAPATQQQFENRVGLRYLALRQADIILMEMENVIGPVKVPTRLRQAIARAPMIYVNRNLEDRVALIKKVYLNNWSNAAEFQTLEQMGMLKKFLSSENYIAIIDSIKEKNFDHAIRLLLKLRYDGAYEKSLVRHQNQKIAEFNLSNEFQEAVDYFYTNLKFSRDI